MDGQDQPISIATIPNGYRVTFSGPLQMNMSRIEEELQQVIAAKPTLVELDLALVPFASSVGLSVLVNLRNALLANGGAIKTVAIQEHVLGTVRFAFLQDLLQITPETRIVKSS